MERKLKETLERLKKKFIGLDETIDNIGKLISPWILTPQIITKPIVISLWGMTGTGKSSLIRELIEELGYLKSTMFLDCGECADTDNSVADKIKETFGFNDDGEDRDNAIANPILVFDEFQYAKTIDETGKEMITGSIRPIWYLIDSGIIDLSNNYSYAISRTSKIIDKIISFSKTNPTIKIEKGYIEDKNIKSIWKKYVYDYYSSPTPNQEKEEFIPVEALEADSIRIIASRLDKIEKELGFKFVDKFYNTTLTLSELADWLIKVKDILSIQSKLDFHNALIFVIGNLDEAYNIGNEVNPDLDADVFYEITSKVTLEDIKVALGTRFRAEQVARLGNNMILYPTLKSKDFKDIIELEITKTLDRFKEHWKGNITVTSKFKELIYSEGVFPVQGVRPVLTTINSIFYPLLSKIILEFKETDEVVIDTMSEDFKVDSIYLELRGRTDSIRIKQKLQLGKLRNPKNRKKRYICSVHEIGHAIVFSYLTGQVPDRIVSVSTDKGGFCSTYNREEEGEIQSRLNIDNEIMTSLGGYLAEELIYGESSKYCLMGSMSDLRLAWVYFSEAAYNLGYFEPVFYTSLDVDSGIVNGIPNGVSSKQIVRSLNGDRITLEEAIEKRMNEFIQETKLILEANEVLIKKGALILGEKGIMLKDEFQKLIEGNEKKYNRSLTFERMKEAKEKLNPDFYKNKLL